MSWFSAVVRTLAAHICISHSGEAGQLIYSTSFNFQKAGCFVRFKHFLLWCLLRTSPHALCERTPFEVSALFFPAHLLP